MRAAIAALDQNGITKIAYQRLHDPAVIPLWFGEGDVVTPDFIRAAAIAALDRGETFYANTRGHPVLLQAIREYLLSIYDVDVHPDRITVPGAAMLGIALAAQMSLSDSDDALVIGPCWPNITAAYSATGANVNFVRQREEANGWQLSVDEIIAAITPRTRSIFLNSPCNPTGWVMPAEEQLALLQVCRERNIQLIADEVYHRTCFDGTAAPSLLSIARDDDPVVVVNGFSKAWAMTGWRVGWVVAPKADAVQWAALSECFNTGATVFAQHGAVAALQQGEATVEQLRTQYRKGRDIVMAALGSHPLIDLARPEGAFYAFPRIRGLRDSFAFAQQLLDEEDVGIAPGYTFGPDNDSHVRLCFAQSHERLEEGLQRMVRFIDRHADELGTMTPTA